MNVVVHACVLSHIGQFVVSHTAEWHVNSSKVPCVCSGRSPAAWGAMALAAAQWAAQVGALLVATIINAFRPAPCRPAFLCLLPPCVCGQSYLGSWCLRMLIRAGYPAHFMTIYKYSRHIQCLLLSCIASCLPT